MEYVIQGGALTVSEDWGAKSAKPLLKWWPKFRDDYKDAACFVAILRFSSDEEMHEYVRTHGQDIEFMSGKHCGVLIFGHASRIDESASAHSARLADFFGLRYDQLPCVLIFAGIDTPSHLIVPMKDMSASDIDYTMRSLFTVIRDAAIRGDAILPSIRKARRQAGLYAKGKKLIGEIGHFADKTLESAIQELIRRSVKNP